MPDGLPRVGSALLVRDEANRILLGKRNKDPQRGRWVIPGGKIRPFETIGEAAARELLEETGLEVEVERHFRVYEIINPPDEHRIVIYSWGRLIGGTARASDDLAELAFFSPDDLVNVQLTPLVRTVLSDAGLLCQRSDELTSKSSQLQFVFFPVLLYGARQNSGDKLQRSRAARKRIKQKQQASSIETEYLLFDI